MNKKTLLFLDALAEHYCTEEINVIARERLQTLFCDTFRKCWPVEQTIWVTTDAKRLREQLVMLWNQILTMTRPSDGISILKRISKLQGRWKELNAIAEGQLYQNGAIDMAQLHVVRSGEVLLFTQWFLELVQIQMYRVLTLGGTARFRRLPLLEDQSAEGLIAYYRDHVVPALESLNRLEITGIWTIEWTPEMALGGRFTVPGCCLAEPEESGCNYLPGRYRRTMRGSHRVYEGRGTLTNITPATILQAQRQGFRSTDQIRVSDLLWIQESDLGEEPMAVLGRVTNQGPYAVDPYDFFSKWGYACGLACLGARQVEGKCPLCGGTLGRREKVCNACMTEMELI